MSSGNHELTLTSMAYGGDAVGRLPDGRTVFVPLCLAGEQVRIRLTEEKEHFARGSVLAVLNASPERVAPRCRHFGICGGCHYQHMSYSAQLSAKAEIVRDQLTRIGRIEHPPVSDTVASPSEWNYRNHIQFQLTAEGRLGFVEASSGHADRGLLAIQECHLPGQQINALWPQLVFEADGKSGKVAIRCGSDDELMLVLEADSAVAPELDIEAAISIAHVFRDDVLIQVGENHVQFELKGRNFRVSPTSFFQVNLAVAEKMVDQVLECTPAAIDTLIDVYCGVGLFSAFLAPRCQRLIGIETSGPACEDFSANLDEFDNVELYEDAAERVLPVLDAKPDVVLLDPPRAGVERSALDALVKMKPAVLVYVSCDPATLARDAARLIRAGYRIESSVPFDMFPQTYHIESISLFKA